MRKLLMAGAMLGLLATDAGAQGWNPNAPPPGYRPPPPPNVYVPPEYRPRQAIPPQPEFRRQPPVVVTPGPSYGPPPGWRHRRAYDWCQAKAARLHEFEFRAQQDGRVSRDEMRISRSLRADLANSCGGGRWAPNRGWYYR